MNALLACVRYVCDDLVYKRSVVVLRRRREVALSSGKAAEVLLREIRIEIMYKG